jgi:hypothetical protein
MASRDLFKTVLNVIEGLYSCQWGPVGETLAYDIVLGVALRINSFQQRNLRLQGAWKWLLSEFSVFYGVSHVYASLR